MEEDHAEIAFRRAVSGALHRWKFDHGGRKASFCYGGYVEEY
jgi:hypothetical protein